MTAIYIWLGLNALIGAGVILIDLLVPAKPRPPVCTLYVPESFPGGPITVDTGTETVTIPHACPGDIITVRTRG